MGTETDSVTRPTILCAYLQTARGKDLSEQLRDRIAMVLAPDQLGPLVHTLDDVEAVRSTLEQMELLHAARIAAQTQIVGSDTPAAVQPALTPKAVARR